MLVQVPPLGEAIAQVFEFSEYVLLTVLGPKHARAPPPPSPQIEHRVHV